MTSQQATEYRKGAISEIQRISGLIKGTMTVRQYNEKAEAPYKFEAIRDRLKVKFNELKVAADLTINKNKSTGHQKRNKKQNNTTERRCNMSHCGRLFEAQDHMRSCPVCNNLKNNSTFY